jgi:arylformamidase
MKYFDVTLTIHEGMPVWPGDDEVVLLRRSKIEEGAHANVSFFSMSAHTGTHVDAPYHFIANGTGVDQLSLDVLMGPVQLVEIENEIKVITAEVVRALHLTPGTIRILFKTRNSEYWNLPREEFQTGFVGIDLGGSAELVKLGIQLVGIDYLSIAPYKNSKPTHDALLESKMVVIEGLDLRGIHPGTYQLACLPLKLGGADGAPARVILSQE